MIYRVNIKNSGLAALITAVGIACGSPKAKSTGNTQTGSAGSAAITVASPGSAANTVASPGSAATDAGSAASNAGTVTISVSSIHLADDCGGGKTPAPAVPAAVSPTAPSSPAVRVRPERAAPGAVPRQHQCDQSALQLQLVAAPTPNATIIAIQKVELLNQAGDVLGELTPRSPTQWMPSGHYAVWDQSIAGGATVKASYALSAPMWPAYGLTRAKAAQQTFRLRVTVTANGNAQVVSGQATVVSPPTPLNIPVPT